MATPAKNIDHGQQRGNGQHLQNIPSCQDNSVKVPQTDVITVNPLKSSPVSQPSRGAADLKEAYCRSNQPQRRNNSWPGALSRSTTSKDRAPESTSSPKNSGKSHQAQCSSEHPCTWPSCPSIFSRLADRDRHYQTVHANQGLRPHTCTVPYCQARVKSWTKVDKLREHNKRWHGPYPCGIQGCPRGNYHGFRSQLELDAHISENHRVKQVSFLSGSKPSPVFSQDSNEVFTPAETLSNVSASSVARVNVHNSKPGHAANISNSRSSKALKRQNLQFTTKSSRFWVPGRAFKVLWSESTAGTDVIYDSEVPASFESRPVSAHTKIRLFIVISASRGHSICVAIHTYGGQGTGKIGLNLADHVAVYGTGSDPPIHDGTETVNQAIAIRLDSSTDTIHPKSCVNLAKLYTVEHNLKVMGVGKVQDSDLPRLQSMTPMQITSLSSQIPAGRGQNTLLKNRDSMNGQPEGRGTSLPAAGFQSPQIFSALGGNNVVIQAPYDLPEQIYLDSNFGINNSTTPLSPGNCHPSFGKNYRARNNFDYAPSGNHYAVPMPYPSPERSLSAGFGSYGNTTQLDPNNSPSSERSYWARTPYDSTH